MLKSGVVHNNVLSFVFMYWLEEGEVDVIDCIDYVIHIELYSILTIISKN
jgi:hypothetical protein